MAEIQPLEVRAFKALCESRALRWSLGLIPREHGGDGWIGYAVDPLQRWAFNHGLDADEAQTIMADAFGPFRGEGEPQAWPQKGVNPDE